MFKTLTVNAMKNVRCGQTAACFLRLRCNNANPCWHKRNTDDSGTRRDTTINHDNTHLKRVPQFLSSVVRGRGWCGGRVDLQVHQPVRRKLKLKPNIVSADQWSKGFGLYIHRKTTTLYDKNELKWRHYEPLRGCYDESFYLTFVFLF